MAQTDDNRTMADLAREAMEVQNACNLSGVAIAFADAICRLRALLPDAGTRVINRHPICFLWINKMQSLSGAADYSPDALTAYSVADAWCVAAIERDAASVPTASDAS